MTIIAQDLVNREVHLCLSPLVSILARGLGEIADKDANELAEQAFELARPLDDWREAASQAGLTLEMKTDGLHVINAPANSDMVITAYDDSEQASIAFCDFHELDPYQTEVYEHWAVSQWFGEKLQAKGEKVDFDFAGLVVWARTCTGQGIASDSVVEAICAELNRPEPTAWLSGADLDNATNPNA